MATLRLGSNAIGDVGALALAEMLRKNATLSALFLGCNDITDSGAEVFAATLGAGANRSLRKLWLNNNLIGPVGGAYRDPFLCTILLSHGGLYGRLYERR